MDRSSVAPIVGAGPTGGTERIDVVTVGPDERLLDREQAQLAFNDRVLAMADNPRVPLAERLRYICIVSSNMDEFFEIRVSALFDEMREQAGIGPAATQWPAFLALSARAHALVERQYALFNEVIMPGLERAGVVVINNAQRDEAQRAWVREYFESEVRPLLSPIGLDPAHPFPQVMNKALNFIVQLDGKDAFGRPSAIAIVKVPRALPRVIPVPARLAGERQAFVLLSSVIRAHLADLFPGRGIAGLSQFRVTRDSDLWVDEGEVKNLRQALRLELTQRHFGNAVRLEVLRTCPPSLEDLLRQQFTLPTESVYRCDGPVNLVRLDQLVGQLVRAEFRWPAFVPAWPRTLPQGADLFESIRATDVLLHHPYESFEPVVEFLRQSAFDPRVVAIRMTLYRTGTASVLVDLLAEASRRGKEVTVVVELKARFDEEANINLAEQLESVGAQVVYGVVGLKIHAKLLLVLRREDSRKGPRLVRYAHLGTGNYHSATAKLYTDFGMLTAHPGLCSDIEKVFMHLTSLTRVERLSHLWLAPFTLHRRLHAAIANEARHAATERGGRIIAKMNALVDEATIKALYAASQAGVRIDLVVRGACSLRPGVPGLSENIRVRSIVGRFLEHHRIYYFRNGGADDVMLASADWMGRNLFRRIEVAWPVLDPRLKRRVIAEGLQAALDDTADAWLLDADGVYNAPRPRGQGVSSQRNLLAALVAEVAAG
jgi:polyphosphate kinase